MAQDINTNPGYKAWHDAQARRREAEPRRRYLAQLQETTRRRVQMKELGDIVAERHRELRQGRS